MDRPIVHALRGAAYEPYSPECVEGVFSEVRKKNPKDSLFGGYAAFLEGLGWVLVEKVMTRQ